tara:strand:- start:396 stop:695 length:300 start_codon:yes stop_codon:yes gene_type:complete
MEYWLGDRPYPEAQHKLNARMLHNIGDAIWESVCDTFPRGERVRPNLVPFVGGYSEAYKRYLVCLVLANVLAEYGRNGLPDCPIRREPGEKGNGRYWMV